MNSANVQYTVVQLRQEQIQFHGPFLFVAKCHEFGGEGETNICILQ